MTIHCGKRALTLTWGILECVFFSGILNGWIWLRQILKDDFYFVENCNVTYTTATPVPDHFTDIDGQKWICMLKRVRIVVHQESSTEHVTTPAASAYPVSTINITNDTTEHSLSNLGCPEQDERVELIISLICIIRNILMLPFGIFLDRYGTSRTRIFAM